MDEGLLWPEGGISRNPDQYAGLLSAGANAAHNIYPDASVVVHLSRSYDQQRCKRHLDVLRQYKVDYDLIGLSLYPSEFVSRSFTMSNGSSATIKSEEDAIAYTMQNMAYLYGIYEKPCMLVEVGVPVQYETRGTLLMTNIMMQALESGVCTGVFYWEPESYDGWLGYDKGAFLQNGHPTQILNAFGM
jgi:arabinogalactan endo-1,4-beta-galactosidase